MMGTPSSLRQEKDVSNLQSATSSASVQALTVSSYTPDEQRYEEQYQHDRGTQHIRKRFRCCVSVYLVEGDEVGAIDKDGVHVSIRDVSGRDRHLTIPVIPATIIKHQKLVFEPVEAVFERERKREMTGIRGAQ